MEELAKLQDWYGAQCNGSWEHTYGISLETIDNPGWHLKIDIVDTVLAAKSFPEVKYQGQDKHDWYICKVDGATFEAFSGPTNLAIVIGIFVHWINR